MGHQQLEAFRNLWGEKNVWGGVVEQAFSKNIDINKNQTQDTGIKPLKTEKKTERKPGLAGRRNAKKIGRPSSAENRKEGHGR